MQHPRTTLGKFLAWRLKHVSNWNFILIASLFVGIVAGGIAVILKTGLHYAELFLTQKLFSSYYSVLNFAYPLAGVFIVALLLRYFYKKHFAYGITNVLYAISQKSSIVKLRDMFYYMGSSFLTVAFGGSVGVEATLVMEGAGTGSNIARFLHLSYYYRRLLLGCGSAAAQAAFFNAPIAGVIFALEVLMLDLSLDSLVPLLMSSVTGAIMGRLFLGEGIMLAFQLEETFVVTDVPFYILLGIACSLLAVYFFRVDQWLENKFNSLRSFWWRALVGGSIVGGLVFLFPPLYGQGYDVLRQLIHGHAIDLLEHSYFSEIPDSETGLLLFIGGMILLKSFAVAATMGGGGVGGFFAPSLFIGGLLGFLFARCFNDMGLSPPLSETHFTLVGMGGVISGVYHAPLTAIFLIAELTKGYALIVPLMIVTIIAYLVHRLFEPYSIFTRRLAKKGQLITHHKEESVLNMLNKKDLIDKKHITVHPGQTLGELLEQAVAPTHRNIFPVTDSNNKLLGVVLMDDIREIMFKEEMHDKAKVQDFMHVPPAYITMKDTLHEVVRKFDETGAWNLPVIDKNEKYIGIISKSRLLSAYRKGLKKFSNM